MTVVNLQLTSGQLLLYIGVSCIAGFGAADFLFRSHLRRAGYREAFLRGHLAYREYLRVKDKHRWPVWPVYLTWAMMGLGIVLTVIGVSRL